MSALDNLDRLVANPVPDAAASPER